VFKLCLKSGFDTSNNQYTLECSVRLHFDITDKRKCYKYNVTNDDICEVQTSEIFKVRLTLITTNDPQLQVHANLSLASAWVNDTEEPECFVRVGFGQTSYTLHEDTGYVEICVISSSPGILSQFVINVITTESLSYTTAFDQSVQSLDFVIGSSDTQCYNISVDFDIDDYCEQYISCNNTLQSQLTKVNENDHVIISKDTVEVIIKEWAGKCSDTRDCGGSGDETPSPSESSTKSTSTITGGVIAALIMSVVVVIAMMGVIVLILFYCRKTKQLKKYFNPSQ
jgi:hypothetical protein